MFHYRTNKLIAIVSLSLIVFFAFLVTGNLLHIKIAGAPGFALSTSLIYISLLIFCALVLFSIILNLTHKYAYEQMEMQEALDAKNKEIERYLSSKKTIVKEEKKDKLNIELLLKKIIPDEKSKQPSLEGYCEQVLINISKNIEIVSGLFFCYDNPKKQFLPKGSYAFFSETPLPGFEAGEGLSGQVAKNKKHLLLSDISSTYLKASSGLGKSDPNQLLIFPILYHKDCIGVIELAAFKTVDEDVVELTEKLSTEIGKQLHPLTKSRKEE